MPKTTTTTTDPDTNTWGFILLTLEATEQEGALKDALISTARARHARGLKTYGDALRVDSEEPDDLLAYAIEEAADLTAYATTLEQQGQRDGDMDLAIVAASARELAMGAWTRLEALALIRAADASDS